MDLEPGQIVTLKSGGPPLTVAGVDGDEVRCIWFAHADDRLQEARIPMACIEAVGEMDPRGRVVADWKEPFREGVVYYLSEGRVRGALLWNTWGQVDAARALIAEPGPFEAKNLVGRIGS